MVIVKISPLPDDSVEGIFILIYTVPVTVRVATPGVTPHAPVVGS